MKPPAFDYVRVDSADEAIALLAEHGEDARVLAGGQSLMPVLNMRLAQPRLLIDVSRCAQLASIHRDASLQVGAAVTQGALERYPTLGDDSPLLAEALPHISHFQVRSRGTVCGSIAHAEPSAELPLALALLKGTVRLRSSRGQRELSADAFQTGMLSTARQDDELIEAVCFPLRARDERQGFAEFARRHGDYAVVAIGACLGPKHLRVAVGGISDRPHVVEWPALAGSALDDALNTLAWSLQPGDDAQVAARQRRQLLRRLGRDLIARLRS